LHLILPQRFFARQQKSRLRFWTASAPAATLAAKKATDPINITPHLRRMWR
jgi:hypothetical protein